jgi:hypothetical protein
MLRTNSTAIGANCKITASNQIMVGTASQKTVMMGNVSVGKTNNSFSVDVSGNINFLGRFTKMEVFILNQCPPIYRVII